MVLNQILDESVNRTALDEQGLKIVIKRVNNYQ